MKNHSIFRISKTLHFHYIFDRCKNTIEAIHGLMSQVIKDKLFNQVHQTPFTPTSRENVAQEAETSPPVAPAPATAAAQ